MPCADYSLAAGDHSNVVDGVVVHELFSAAVNRHVIVDNVVDRRRRDPTIACIREGLCVWSSTCRSRCGRPCAAECPRPLARQRRVQLPLPNYTSPEPGTPKVNSSGLAGIWSDSSQAVPRRLHLDEVTRRLL